MRIYMDNCCYNRPYDDQSQVKISLETQAKLHIQDLIKDDFLELVSSWFVTYENSVNPHDIRRKAIQNFLEENVRLFISSDRFNDVEKISSSIIDSGIKEMDAYHIASAILAKCDYFLTTDKRLLKYAGEELKVMNPIDFINELEVENDGE